MKYLVINPYHNASHGIANYIKNLKSIVNDIDLISFDNKKNLSPIEFREEVLKYVTTKFGYDDVIIEAPEAKASTLLLPAKYNVHIRLHCPLAVAQKYDGQTPNQQEYSNELRVINKAKLVSSPSYALVKEIGNELKSTQVTYYKNPIDIGDSEKNVDKQYDLVFMGRFQELKGTSHINKILENLPENYNVLLFGAKSETLKISPKVKCKVYKKGQVLGNARFDLIRKSKCLMMPSNFENCSMVILESLACHVPVVTWDVGGNKEIAPPSIIKCAKLGDYNDYSRKIVSFIENPPSSNDFTSAIDCINKDFSTGITHLINEIAQKTIIPYLGMNNEKLHIYEPTRNDQTITEINKLRVFGIAYSNEHIEELWGPVISYLGYEYRYVSRQPLGHHTVFKHEPFQIEKKWFCHFDWIKDPARLINQIKNYRPNFILFHNGAHPIYAHVLKSLKQLKIPIIYSELGWFPQKDHIYFDKWGVNGLSYLASQTTEQLCGRTFVHEKEYVELKGDYALIVTQLENDTNLIVNSPRFKNNETFIKHVVDKISDKTDVIIKPHPLDKYKERYEKFASERVRVEINTDTNTLLKNAHSVIGINSTVLLQALEFDVNIYSYGHSILDNKNIAINCISDDIDSLWSNKLKGSREIRNSVIENLKLRQINLLDIREKIKPSDISLIPLVENNIFDFTHIIDINLKPTQHPISLTKIDHVQLTFPTGSKKSKKLKKLIKKPKLFFNDMLKNLFNHKNKVMHKR